MFERRSAIGKTNSGLGYVKRREVRRLFLVLENSVLIGRVRSIAKPLNPLFRFQVSCRMLDDQGQLLQNW